MPLTRRELLELAGLLALSGPAAARADDPLVRRATEAIRGYSAEGLHRTATPVDRASGDRLLALARATRAAATLESFELSRVVPVAAFVEIDGTRIDGLPMFDGAFTGAEGVSGAIGPMDKEQSIAWTRIPPNGEAALRDMRTGSRHRAIVAVTMGGKPGLCPVNAGWFSEPFGPPVLQVGSEHLDAFEHMSEHMSARTSARASEAARIVRVVAHATRTNTQAVNVIADVPGAQPDLPPVCVMTPRSGWHANASERGGGLACWLEALRAVVATRDPARAGRHALRTVKFVASSGHELGHLGLHAYLKKNPELARDAFAWVHLGANIGTSTGDTAMTPSDDRLRAAALRAFAPHGLDKIRQSAATQVGGEAATISEAGGRFVSFIGRNDWFHNPRDLWPDAVDVQAVARFARAVGDLTVGLANTPPA